jgi:hypothetical protein
MARELGRSSCFVVNYMKRNLLQVPEETKKRFRLQSLFRHGMSSWNKGKKLTSAQKKKIRATMFMKGHTPHNAASDGTIALRKDNDGRVYKYIKLKGKKQMQFLHLHLWNQAHGKVPSGKIIVFKDRNSMNCVIENLEAITRRENMMRNTIQRYPEEIKHAIRTISKLNRKINQHEKQD